MVDDDDGFADKVGDIVVDYDDHVVDVVCIDNEDLDQMYSFLKHAHNNQKR